eukprot:Filipodium_phascolosomae@DN1912_c0_g1_i1.p1
MTMNYNSIAAVLLLLLAGAQLCGAVPEWDSGSTYVGGSEVCRSGSHYKAKWWAGSRDDPLKAASNPWSTPWKLLSQGGPCGGGGGGNNFRPTPKPTNARPTYTAPTWTAPTWTAPRSTTRPTFRPTPRSTRPPPPQGSGGSSVDGVALYEHGTEYQAGDRVSWKSTVYECKEWPNASLCIDHVPDGVDGRKAWKRV